jgi:tetratricopeptide (TPR) repeat protein
MIRAIALAATLGALTAAAAVYTFTASRPQTKLAATVDEWPICTTMGSLADSADWAQLDPDFAAGKKAMAAGDWNAAIAALKSAALRDPGNADIQNYIGYAYRRLRQLEPAFAHYRQALEFNPRHRAAHEHMGEAYLALGNLADAEQHLAALERADTMWLAVTNGCTAIAMTRGTVSPSRYSVSNWRFSIASNSGTDTFISK